MASKNITIKEESYDRLRSIKREGESFSDVIDRLTTEESDIEAGFGVFATESEDEIPYDEVIEDERERMDREIESRSEEVFE